MEPIITTYEKNYKIVNRVGDTAITKDGKKSRLVNLKTGEVIFDYDPRVSIYENNDRFFKEHTEVIVDYGDITYLSIYDPRRRTILCEDYVLEKEYNDYKSVKVLRDPRKNKLHLLNLHHTKGLGPRFQLEWDDIELLGTQAGEQYFRLTNGDKEQLYCSNEDLPYKKQYDEITQKGITLFFRKGKEHTFIVNYVLSMDRFESPVYDEVKMIDKNIICGRRGNEIDVYWVTVFNVKKMFTIKADKLIYVADKITNVYDHLHLYYFGAKKNGKYALVRCLVNTKYKQEETPSRVTTYKYNSISSDKNNIILSDGENIDYFQRPFDDYQLVKSQYYSNEELFLDYQVYYRDKDKNRCDIKKLSRKKPIITNCKILEDNTTKDSPYYSLKFEKDGKVGILSAFEKDGNKPLITRFGNKNECVVINGYDDAIYLGGGFYLVTRNNLQGLVVDSKEIIPPIYKSIDIHGPKYDKDYDCYRYASRLYLKLQKEDGTIELKQFNNTTKKEIPFLEDIDLSKYKNITFYDTFVVFETENEKAIQTYGGKVLKVLPSDTVIEERDVKCQGDSNRKAIYFNKTYYKMNTNSLEALPTKTMYAAYYESPFGYVVINEEDPYTFDAALEQMNSIDEDELDCRLLLMWGQSKELQQKYPRLCRRRRD